MGATMSGLGLSQLIAHGFAKLSPQQRVAGAFGPLTVRSDGALIKPDGSQIQLASNSISQDPGNSIQIGQDGGLLATTTWADSPEW
jgi:hypothetical protein